MPVAQSWQACANGLAKGQARNTRGAMSGRHATTILTMIFPRFEPAPVGRMARAGILVRPYPGLGGRASNSLLQLDSSAYITGRNEGAHQMNHLATIAIRIYLTSQQQSGAPLNLNQVSLLSAFVIALYLIILSQKIRVIIVAVFRRPFGETTRIRNKGYRYSIINDDRDNFERRRRLR